jgi:MFS family permease
MGKHDAGRRCGLLREAPRFRYLWLSRTISSTGIGMSRVALVLLASPHGPATVSAVLLASTLPQLLGPVAGAVADRVDQRRLLAGCEAGQGVIYAVIAVARPPVPVLLPLVAVAGLLATLFSPAGKSSVPRLVPADRLPRANALLGMALNLQLMAGPAIGGLLVGLAGPPAAFGANAGTFAASALLLGRLGPLPPAPPAATAPATSRGGLMSETWAGLSYAARAPVPRSLVLATLLFVSFAAIDNVALVFLVSRDLHGSAAGYGAVVAAFGTGMLAASLALAMVAARRPPQQWLIGGIAAGAAGTAGTGLAASIGLASVAQAVAGAGNTADLVGTDTLIQQVVPAHLLGRVFGAVYTAAQAGSGIAYAAAAPLVALTSPRIAFFIAGTGMLTGLLVLIPALRAAKRGPGASGKPRPADPVTGPAGLAPAGPQ